MLYVNLGYLQSCRHIQLQDPGAQSGVYIIQTKVSNKILNVFVIWKHMVEDGHLFGATGSIKSDNFFKLCDIMF